MNEEEVRQADRGRSVHVHPDWTQYDRTLMTREHLNATPELLRDEKLGLKTETLLFL